MRPRPGRPQPARPGRSLTVMEWIESEGGPLVVVPAAALDRWRGAATEFDTDDVDSWGDYGRACQIDGYAGILDLGDDRVLVLSDEPAATTYVAERGLFVRWIYAGAEAEVVRLLPAAVRSADWVDAGVWTTGGSACLFDAAFAGPEVEVERHLTVDLAAGSYRVRVAYTEPAKGTALVLVQLAAVT